MKAVLFTVLAAAGLIIVISMLRTKKFAAAVVLSSLEGIAALFGADLIGSFVSVSVPINAYTLVFCAAGGIPAVIFMLIAGVFLR